MLLGGCAYVTAYVENIVEIPLQEKPFENIFSSYWTNSSCMW